MDKKEVYKFICVLWEFAKSHLDIPETDEGWDELVEESKAVAEQFGDEIDNKFITHLLNGYLLCVHLTAKNKRASK